MQVFDIQSLDVTNYSEDGTLVRIVNPKTGDYTGLVIKVKGAFASRFQELLSRQRKRDALRAKNPVARAVSDEDDDTSQLLAEVTLGWYTVTGKDDDGKEIRVEAMFEASKQLPFSKSEAARVYEMYPVIRGQVLSSALDVANFVKG